MKDFYLFLIAVSVALQVSAEHIQAREQQRDTLRNTRTLAVEIPLGQEENPFPKAFLYPDLVIPSPDGCALIRSISIPVDKYTGVANIQIPITEINVGEDLVPVALSYQASGIKVQDFASTVGLGWRLVAGGRITRDVRGWADNLEDFSNRTEMLDEKEWNKLDMWLQNKFDTEPDLFYFEYPGGGGVFIFDENGVPRTIPGQNIRIEYQDKQFTITDENGTEYLYMTSETTQYSIHVENEQDESTESYLSTWFLDRIRYSNGMLVVFNYEEADPYRYTNTGAQFDVEYGINSKYVSISVVRNTEAAIDILNPKYLSSIRYKDYFIGFSYDTMRSDIPGLRKLNSITTSHSNRNNRKYEFSYDKFKNESLKLLAVNDVSLAKTTLNICSFDYYEMVNLPARNYFGTDHWGYFNGYGNDTLRCPETDIISERTGELIHISGASKKPYLPTAQANSIRRINYPTGGTKTFEYELHKGINPATGAEQEAGGLRIKKIVETSLSTTRTYSYAYSGGIIYADTVNYCLYTYSGSAIEGYHCMLSSHNVNDITDMNGCSVIYSVVKEYLPNGSAVEYHYVPYNHAKDEPGELYNPSGSSPVYMGPDTTRMSSVTSRHWLRNLLQKEVQYDSEGEVVKTISYDYTRLGNVHRICGIHVFSNRYQVFPNPVAPVLLIHPNYLTKYYLESQPVVVSKATVAQGRYNLASKTEYLYDDTTLCPVQIIRIDSSGCEKKVTFTYPDNYPTDNASDVHTPALAAMKNNHMISAPIETVIWKNGRMIGSTLNLYNVMNGYPVLTETRQYFCDPDMTLNAFSKAYVDDNGYFVADDSYVTTWKAENFDSDNTLLSFSDKGGRETSVLYGYRNMLPIAVIQNATCGPEDAPIETYKETLHYSEGKNYFSLQRPQTVHFETAILETGTIGQELEIRIEDQGSSVARTFFQSYVYPVNNRFDFTADLPAGNFFIYFRWTEPGLASDYPDAETHASVNIYRPSAIGPPDYAFHTSFETETNPITIPSTTKYVFFDKAKSGERVCTAPYELTFRADFFHRRDSLEMTHWEYHTRKANPRWEQVRTVIPSGTGNYTYTIEASDSVYIDEVRVMPFDAMMTTYTYKPGIGKLSETDPSGVTTHYRYDDAGRLIAILNTEGQMLKRYTYENYNKIVEESINGNAELQTSIVYLDELGRKEQVIDVKSTPGKHDMVQFWNYDNMGRDDSFSFLPYARTVSDGLRRTNPLAESRTCYQSQNSPDLLAYPYVRKFYDDTPQGAVLKIRAPHAGMSREEKYDTDYSYGFNSTADSVRQYLLRQDSSLVWQADYPSGTLRKVEVRKSLTDSKQSVVRKYFDSDDRLVMCETAAAEAAVERTYYLYDDFGRQRAIIPAPGNALFTAKNIAPASADLQKYCYFSVYDRFGRVSRQLTPGAGWEYRLYDDRDRLVMSQTAQMRVENRWLFNRYDIFDRPVMTGIHTGGTFETHRAALEVQTPGYPALQAETNILTEYYYDNYDWRSGDLASVFFSYPCTRSMNREGSVVRVKEQTRPRPYVPGLETGRKCKVLGIDENVWLTTLTFYDTSNRVVQSVSEHYQKTDTGYKLNSESVVNHRDAVGNVTAVFVRHLNGQLGYLKEMSYDHRDRLTSIKFLTYYDRQGAKVMPPPGFVNGYDTKNGKVVVASYMYDELGRVHAKSIHNGLETTIYDYDMTHLRAVTSPSFSYSLGYDTPTVGASTPRYDGLLSEVLWQHGAGTPQGYTYTYDVQGQMESACYFEKVDGNWAMQRKYWELPSYGACGMVNSITRSGAAGSMGSINQRYDGFRLTGTDMDGILSDDYRYDADGNVTYDGHQKVGIQYNILGLPERIFDNSHEIHYIYTSGGQKVAMSVDGSFTYYRNAIQYEGDSKLPSRILHPEGFFEFATSTYKYFKTDHLGSVRCLLAADDGDTLTAEQSADYYPFGLVHGQFENLHLNRHLFSGKELQDANVGNQGLLGWYDFGARQYNPALGHWMTPDPLLQFQNPYLYCMNSPVNFIDKWGLKSQKPVQNGGSGDLLVDGKEIAAIEVVGKAPLLDAPMSGSYFYGYIYGLSWGVASSGLASIRKEMDDFIEFLQTVNTPGETLNALNDLAPDDPAVLRQYGKISRSIGLGLLGMQAFDVIDKSISGKATTEDYIDFGISLIGAANSNVTIVGIMLLSYKRGFMYISDLVDTVNAKASDYFKNKIINY